VQQEKLFYFATSTMDSEGFAIRTLRRSRIFLRRRILAICWRLNLALWPFLADMVPSRENSGMTNLATLFFLAVHRAFVNSERSC